MLPAWKSGLMLGKWLTIPLKKLATGIFHPMTIDWLYNNPHIPSISSPKAQKLRSSNGPPRKVGSLLLFPNYFHVRTTLFCMGRWEWESHQPRPYEFEWIIRSFWVKRLRLRTCSSNQLLFGSILARTIQLKLIGYLRLKMNLWLMFSDRGDHPWRTRV